VLRRLTEIWRETPFCLVGASAIACHIDRYWRQTLDLDLSVSVALDELASQLAAIPELRPHPKLEHEWLGPGGVKVDILPVGTAALDAGEIVWPKSQFPMNVRGFRLAFELRQPVAIAPEVTIDVAPLAVIGMLEMIAYQDRRRRSRAPDGASGRGSAPGPGPRTPSRRSSRLRSVRCGRVHSWVPRHRTRGSAPRPRVHQTPPEAVAALEAVLPHALDPLVE
jgi:hypothetical protein